MTLTKMLAWICRYCLKCTKFGYLFLRKIINIVDTRCRILRLKWTKFGAYSAPKSLGGAENSGVDKAARWSRDGHRECRQRESKKVAFKCPTSKGNERKKAAKKGARKKRRKENGKGRKKRRKGEVKRKVPWKQGKTGRPDSFFHFRHRWQR